MKKLDKFKGTIDFKKDSPDKIQKTLTQLKEYLNSYQEDEASKIVEDFAKANSKDSKEQALNEKFLKAYEQRTSTLIQIRKSIKRIQEDLINEQDSKAKGSSFKWGFKSKSPLGPQKKESKENEKLKKGPLEWLKDALFGSLFGGLVSRLLKPLKWIVGGLFAVGKFGFKIVSKLVGKILKSSLSLAMKAGGFLFKPIKDLITKTYDNKFKPKIDELKDSFNKKIDDVKGKVDGLKSKVKDKFDDVKGKVKKTKDSAGSAISKFFSSIGNSIKSKASQFPETIKSNLAKAYKLAKTSGANIKKSVGKAISGISDKAKQQWAKLADKVKSIGTKLTTFFKKKSGKATSKIVPKLASRLPKALGKFASKFVPGLGLALLAYDVYSAAKKSNSIVSFAVNLVDEVTGGLLSMGLDALLDDFDGENLGEYVETLIKGSNLGLSNEELNIMDGLELSKLENAGSSTTNIINNIDSISMDGSNQSMSQLEKSLSSNPKKDKIVAEYKRLATLKASGKITDSEAKNKFKEFINKEIPNASVSTGTSIDPLTGIEYDASGNPAVVKNSDTNLAAYDASGALQAQASLITMQSSAQIAAQTAHKISQSYGNVAIQISQNKAPTYQPELQTVVQG